MLTFEVVNIHRVKVNLLFVVDEVSDDQNGKDAKVTCDILASVMEDPCWDDGSLLARITQEYIDSFHFSFS